MPTNLGTDSAILNQEPVIAALKLTDPAFTKLSGITLKTGVLPDLDTFDFISEPKRTGFIIRNPVVNVNKTEIRDFLQAVSGINITAAQVANVRIYPLDSSFVEVIKTLT